jgi:hypothetical protein
MGPSAVIEVGSIQILIATYPTYDWADEQYRSMGMNPAGAKFVEVKNMMNFRFGYRDIMKGFFVLDLGGRPLQTCGCYPLKELLDLYSHLMRISHVLRCEFRHQNERMNISPCQRKKTFS